MTNDTLSWPGVHRALAARCFNDTWELLDLERRTPAQDEEMLRLTFASHFHWTQRDDYSPVKASIAHWQVSRVFAVLGEGALALRFGRAALHALDGTDDPPAFAIAYAHEAIARGAAVVGDPGLTRDHHAEATALLDALDGETRAALTRDLRSL